MNFLKTLIASITSLLIVCLYLEPSAAESKAGPEKILFIDTNASCITSDCHSLMGNKRYVHAIGVDPLKCRRCHEVERDGEHTFTPTPVETEKLCSQCHGKNASTPPDVIGNPVKVISTGEGILHKPFEEGKCTACHDAHESNNFNHLKAEYPEGPYATFSPGTYRLCFTNKCHEGFEKTLEEPRLMSGTLFRNGNLNLHFKHVNKEKGRTCRTCHLNHGARNSKLVTHEFKFGSRTLSLEYEKTNTGGSCVTPCHSAGKYDRYEPVSNSIQSTPTPGKDATMEELNAVRESELQEEKPVEPQKKK